MMIQHAPGGNPYRWWSPRGARDAGREAPERLPSAVRGATCRAQDTGIVFSGSTNGIGTTVAARVPHSVSTVTGWPSVLRSAGSHAYPMFAPRRGEWIAD